MATDQRSVYSTIEWLVFDIGRCEFNEKIIGRIYSEVLYDVDCIYHSFKINPGSPGTGMVFK
jgi:hypothetical protein